MLLFGRREVASNGPRGLPRDCQVAEEIPPRSARRPVTWDFSALGGTRTPNLLIRRRSRRVRLLLSTAVLPAWRGLGSGRCCRIRARDAPWIAKEIAKSW